MQWLIDLIIETIGVPPCFIGLSQLNGARYEAGLVIDNAWHEIDMSQDLPATGVKGLNVHMTGESTDVGDVLYVRATYDNIARSTCAIRIQVANLTIGERRCIGIDTDQKFEYRFFGTGWLNYKIHVRGYWL